MASDLADQILAILDTSATPDQLAALEALLIRPDTDCVYRLATPHDTLLRLHAWSGVKRLYPDITSVRQALRHTPEGTKIQRARVRKWEDVT